MYINPLQGLTDSPAIKANFHTHAGTGPGTCGAYSIDEVLGGYREADYGCMCISNHNVYVDMDTEALEEKYGMVLFCGYEYTAWEHLVCMGTKNVVLNHGETSVEHYQGAIDSCNADGGFSIMCHPNWPYEWGVARDFARRVHGFQAMELHNGRSGSNAYDYLLTLGRLIWGVGSDDFHRWWNLGRAWTMVYSPGDKASIMAALRRGACYVSTGLVCQRFELEKDVLRVSVLNTTGYRDEFNYRFIGEGGRVLREVNEETASYRFNGTEKYVRVEAMNNAGQKFYSQPVYDDACLVPDSI